MDIDGKRNLRHKVVKIVYFEESEESSDQKEDSDYEYDEDEEDSDYGGKRRKNKKSKMDEGSDEDGPERTGKNYAKKGGGPKSEYEQLIEKNRAEKMAFLQSLNIDEAKSSLMEAMNVPKKNARPNTKRINKIDYSTLVGHRKSTRLADVSIDLSEAALSDKAYEVAKLAEKKERHIPKSIPFKDASDDVEWYKSYVDDVDIQESEKEPQFVSYDKPMLTSLSLDTAMVASIIPNRITSLVWYPDPEYLVIASGNSLGNVGIWNPYSKPYLFKPHTGGVTNLQFSPWNRVHMFSSSTDGALTCGDMVKHVFDEVYSGEDKNTSFTYFDFLSESTYLITQNNGEVVLLDNRAGKCSERIYKCHDNAIKFVNVHPVNRSYFITSTIKGAVCLWDLRKLHNKFVADIGHHTRSVHSAFFSPVTGNSILTTSADIISIFNSTELTENIKVKKLLRYKIEKKKSSSFRATWLPNSEEAFYISHTKTARAIQVYDKNMDVYHEMGHDLMHSVVPTNVFHPYRPAVACASPSGKVYVYK